MEDTIQYIPPSNPTSTLALYLIRLSTGHLSSEDPLLPLTLNRKLGVSITYYVLVGEIT